MRHSVTKSAEAFCFIVSYHIRFVDWKRQLVLIHFHSWIYWIVFYALQSVNNTTIWIKSSCNKSQPQTSCLREPSKGLFSFLRFQTSKRKNEEVTISHALSHSNTHIFSFIKKKNGSFKPIAINVYISFVELLKSRVSI